MKKRAKQFYSENVLMSVMGHLVLVAIMITSIVWVVERAEMVTPDRVEIMEIDLSNVKISVDETKLYNTNVPKNDVAETVKEEPKTAPKQEPVAKSKDKITDSVIDDVDEKKTDKKTETNKTDVKPKEAPKKKTVVRVNREVLSLDRTLTVSVVDALRVAMTRCWVVDTNRSGLADIRAVAHLKMRPNGTVADVWFESAARAETDPGFAYVLDTIRAAIRACEPLSMLPRSEFSKWESIQLTFYPVSGRVM